MQRSRVVRPSVHLSVCLSRRSTAAATCGWSAAEGGRGRRVAAVDSIDICHRRRRSAANAGSVVLTAERRGYIVGGLVFRHSTLCTVTFDTIGNVVVS